MPVRHVPAMRGEACAVNFETSPEALRAARVLSQSDVDHRAFVRAAADAAALDVADARSRHAEYGATEH